MQIILSDEEVETLYESLLTKRGSLEEELEREQNKARRELAQKQLTRVTALQKRFFPYIKG